MDYTKIKELKIESDVETVNELLKKEWILVLITSTQGKTEYLLGRIWFRKTKYITIYIWCMVIIYWIIYG